MLPRLRSSDLVNQWIWLTVGASIGAWLGGGLLIQLVALVPSRVLYGEVWRLVTWPVVEVEPISLVVTCAIIYKLGGDLAARWGDRRLLRFMLQIVIATAVVTCLMALAVGAPRAFYLGGWVISDVLVIAWARQFPSQPLRVYGVLELHGRQLVNLTLAVAVLMTLRWGLVAMAPELISCLIATTYPTRLLRR